MVRAKKNPLPPPSGYKVNTTTIKKMDSELCNLIMILDSKDKIENLQQKIKDFYTSKKFSVNDPKSVSGGKGIDIEGHST